MSPSGSSLVRLTVCLATAFAAGCTPVPGDGGGDDGGEGGDSVAGGDASTGGKEFDPCLQQKPKSCAAPLVCAAFRNNAFCVTPCTLPAGACGQDRICAPREDEPTQGFCAEERGTFQTCAGDDLFTACPRDTYCLSQSLHATDRCVPICDVGTLGDFEAVTSCPDLPTELGGGPTSCLPIDIGTASGSLCGVEVAVGAPCDQGALRCNLDKMRPDSDGSLGGTPDPGTLSCLPTAEGARCLRVCTNDNFVQEATCVCPLADPACTDPVDPGLAWDCVDWSLLSADMGACVPLEDCSTDTSACDNNTTSGLSQCDPTPYETGPANICAPAD